MIDFNASTKYTESPILLNELELFIQELNLMFRTEKGDVFGDNKRGSNIETLLWKLNVSQSQIQYEIAKEVQTGCFMHEFFTWDISVTFLNGTFRDIAFINVIIDLPDGTQRIEKYIYK